MEPCETLKVLIEKYGLKAVEISLAAIKTEKTVPHVRRARTEYIVREHRNNNRTFTDIAKELGISGGRVAQIFNQAERMERHSKMSKEHDSSKVTDAIEYLDLTIRAFSALRRSGIKTIPDLVNKMKTGEVAPGKLPNFGNAAYGELLVKLESKGIHIEVVDA